MHLELGAWPGGCALRNEQVMSTTAAERLMSEDLIRQIGLGHLPSDERAAFQADLARGARIPGGVTVE